MTTLEVKDTVSCKPFIDKASEMLRKHSVKSLGGQSYWQARMWTEQLKCLENSPFKNYEV